MVRHRGARSHRCSPVIAEKDEGDEEKPAVGSPEHERQWRGDVMVEEDGIGRSSMHGC
jgi:hypothetical protein